MLPTQIMEKKPKVPDSWFSSGFLLSHGPVFFPLPPQIVYVTRNPRDTCVSLLNHMRVLEGYSGDLNLLVDVFLKDMAGYYTPFIQHVLEYWNKR